MNETQKIKFNRRRKMFSQFGTSLDRFDELLRDVRTNDPDVLFSTPLLLKDQQLWQTPKQADKKNPDDDKTALQYALKILEIANAIVSKIETMTQTGGNSETINSLKQALQELRNSKTFRKLILDGVNTDEDFTQLVVNDPHGIFLPLFDEKKIASLKLQPAQFSIANTALEHNLAQAQSNLRRAKQPDKSSKVHEQAVKNTAQTIQRLKNSVKPQQKKRGFLSGIINTISRKIFGVPPIIDETASHKGKIVIEPMKPSASIGEGKKIWLQAPISAVTAEQVLKTVNKYFGDYNNGATLVLDPASSQNDLVVAALLYSKITGKSEYDAWQHICDAVGVESELNDALYKLLHSHAYSLPTISLPTTPTFLQIPQPPPPHTASTSLSSDDKNKESPKTDTSRDGMTDGKDVVTAMFITPYSEEAALENSPARVATQVTQPKTAGSFSHSEILSRMSSGDSTQQPVRPDPNTASKKNVPATTRAVPHSPTDDCYANLQPNPAGTGGSPDFDPINEELNDESQSSPSTKK